MKHAIAAALLATLATLATSLQAQEAEVILTMNAYGPVQIGMPLAEARRMLVKLGRKNLPAATSLAKTGCARYRVSDELQFLVEDGKLVRIETRERHVVTPSGIKIGTPVEKVRRALGSRVEETQRQQSNDANDRSIVLLSGDKRFAIRVEANSVVTEIDAGAAHAIRAVEGCS